MIDRLFNLDHAFFARAWRRYVTLAVCFIWAGGEAAQGNWGWAVLFGGLGVVAWWQFRKVDWSKYDGGH